MTTTQTPGGSSVGLSSGTIEPGRFDRLSLVATLVIDPRTDPLPEVGVSGGIPTIRFAEEYGTDLVIAVQQRAPKESQAAYLYALGASLTALAREVEGR